MPSQDQQVAPEGAASSSSSQSLIVLAAAAVVGLIAGGGLGAYVVGPRLDPHPAVVQAAEADVEAEDGGHGAEEEGGHGAEAGKAGEDGHGPAGGPVHTVDNLVVNPAGTRGRRFLVTTVALDLQSQAAVEELTARDPELRDALLSVLGAKTVAELADTAARDSLKSELEATVEETLEVDVSRLYMPQFVIQ